MNTILRLLRVLLCALLLLASSASIATATHGRPEQLLPIGGALVGFDEEPDSTAEGCTPVGAPLLWRFTSQGTGTVSRLGRVTYHLTHCTHVDLTITEGVLRLKAANGDTLVLHYTARVTQYTPGDPIAFWEHPPPTAHRHPTADGQEQVTNGLPVLTHPGLRSGYAGVRAGQYPPAPSACRAACAAPLRRVADGCCPVQAEDAEMHDGLVAAMDAQIPVIARTRELKPRWTA